MERVYSYNLAARTVYLFPRTAAYRESHLDYTSSCFVLRVLYVPEAQHSGVERRWKETANKVVTKERVRRKAADGVTRSWAEP